MRPRPSIFLSLLLALTLAVTSCGDDDETVGTAGDEPADQGGGGFGPGEYQSIEVTENGETRPLVEGTVINLNVDETTVSLNAGCNHLSGPYTFEDDKLTVTNMGGTEMGCDPARYEQDQWLSEFLGSGPTVSSAGDGFVLDNGTTSMRFVDRESAEPSADLVGTTWEVTGFIDGEVASSLPAGLLKTPVVVFDPSGFVTGHDGCNGFGFGGPDAGPPTDGLAYVVEGSTLTFNGDPATDLMLCEIDVRAELFAALTGQATYEITGPNLTIVARDGQGATFTATGRR